MRPALLVSGSRLEEVIVVSLLCFTCSLFPASIIGRDKPHAMSIFLLNFFLGWTVVGWIAALYWALWPRTARLTCTMSRSAQDTIARAAEPWPPAAHISARAAPNGLNCRFQAARITVAHHASCKSTFPARPWLHSMQPRPPTANGKSSRTDDC